MDGFYTYMWLRENGTPYYVGKGTKNRAFRKTSPPKSRIVVYPAESEQDAFETEIALIWYYGRKDLGTGCLKNLTYGGDGVSGWERTPKWREHQKFCMTGRHPTIEVREKMSAWQVGKQLSEETKKKISERAQGRSHYHLHTEESKAKISQKLKGRVITPEWREKLRIAALNRRKKTQ